MTIAMKTKLLIHLAKDRNGGEFRRIARLSKDSDQVLQTNTVELVFLPLRLLRNVKSLKANPLGSRVILLPVLLPFTRFKIVGRINHAISVLLAKSIAKRVKPDYLWGETLGGNSIAVSLQGNWKYIADFHGASPEESYYFRPNKNALERSNNIEGKVVNKADVLVVQSTAMKSHLIKKHQLRPDRILVYNCGVNTDLFDFHRSNISEIRKELGYADSDVVFLYAGGTNKWQMLYETLDIYKCVEEKASNVRCLMLIQGDTTPLEDYCNRNKISTVRFLKNVQYDNVYKYLSIANFGWLLREDIILNQVASPTKLGEYLSCGLRVVTTSVINNWTWLDEKDAIVVPLGDNDKAAGIIYNHLFLNSDISSREKMRTIAINNLSTNNDYSRLSEMKLLV